jgi:hypothetical protein
LPTREAKEEEGCNRRSQVPVTAHQIRIKETMMRNEIKIVEDGVIFELEIEEVEEVVAPTVIVAG